MELFKLFAELLEHLAWPSVILVLAIRFAPTTSTLIENIAGNLSPKRNIRAKFGNIELESNEVSIKEDELAQIVKEDDPAKRLEFFKKKFDLEKVIQQIENHDLEWLQKFSEEYHIPNAFLVWPWGENSKEEIEAYNRLEKFGLVKTYPAPMSGGEWIGVVTDSGKKVLHLLIKHQLPNNSKENT
jgi:hypothetical protein